MPHSKSISSPTEESVTPSDVELPAEGTEECVTIQFAEQNGVLPYPYHVICADGAIGRQDYWRGKPAQLIGFVDRPGKQDVTFLFGDWLAEPERAIGNYPVFASADGRFSTAMAPVASIQHGHARR